MVRLNPLANFPIKKLYYCAIVVILTFIPQESDDVLSSHYAGENELDEEFEGLSHGNKSPEGDLEQINIDCLPDIFKIDMNNISLEEVERYNFCDLNVAYQFYYWFGRRTRFLIRKSLMIRNRT